MVDKGLISQEKEECTDLHTLATKEGARTVYPVFYEEHGYSGRYVYFSVFTGIKAIWSLPLTRYWPSGPASVVAQKSSPLYSHIFGHVVAFSVEERASH